MTEFAICEGSDGTIIFTVELAQAPGKASAVRTSIAAGDPSTTYRIQVNTLGDITTTANACDNTGTEYRPLQETDKYGRPNEF
jgi:hypothetical protein